MERTVTAIGHGSTRVAPDSATLRVAATHRAPGVLEACAGVASAMAVMGEVARRFTNPSRISSTDFGLWPAHDDQGRCVGFEARHGLAVSVPDIGEAGRLVTELADEVGERLQVEGISLDLSEPGAAESAARELAFADATERAAHLARLGGCSLGPVLAVAEGAAGSGRPWAEVAPAALRAEKDVAFEPGERVITVSVTVTWALG